MDIPEERILDLNWLLRNLAFRNSNHPKFDEVMKLMKIELKNKNINKNI